MSSSETSGLSNLSSIFAQGAGTNQSPVQGRHESEVSPGVSIGSNSNLDFDAPQSTYASDNLNLDTPGLHNLADNEGSQTPFEVTTIGDSLLTKTPTLTQNATNPLRTGVTGYSYWGTGDRIGLPGDGPTDPQSIDFFSGEYNNQNWGTGLITFANAAEEEFAISGFTRGMLPSPTSNNSKGASKYIKNIGSDGLGYMKQSSLLWSMPLGFGANGTNPSLTDDSSTGFETSIPSKYNGSNFIPNETGDYLVGKNFQFPGVLMKARYESNYGTSTVISDDNKYSAQAGYDSPLSYTSQWYYSSIGETVGGTPVLDADENEITTNSLAKTTPNQIPISSGTYPKNLHHTNKFALGSYYGLGYRTISPNLGLHTDDVGEDSVLRKTSLADMNQYDTLYQSVGGAGSDGIMKSRDVGYYSNLDLSNLSIRYQSSAFRYNYNGGNRSSEINEPYTIVGVNDAEGDFASRSEMSRVRQSDAKKRDASRLKLFLDSDAGKKWKVDEAKRGVLAYVNHIAGGSLDNFGGFLALGFGSQRFNYLPLLPGIVIGGVNVNIGAKIRLAKAWPTTSRALGVGRYEDVGQIPVASAILNVNRPLTKNPIADLFSSTAILHKGTGHDFGQPGTRSPGYLSTLGGKPKQNVNTSINPTGDPGFFSSVTSMFGSQDGLKGDIFTTAGVPENTNSIKLSFDKDKDDKKAKASDPNENIETKDEDSTNKEPKENTLDKLKKAANSYGKAKGATAIKKIEDVESSEHGMPFYFKDLRDNTYVIFRAYLDSITEDVSPEWNSGNYIGRSEPVYTYKGAERLINFSVKLYAFTKDELKAIYIKMDRLTSMAYPKYKADRLFITEGVNKVAKTRMIPPLAKLRIGELYGSKGRELPGFIKSLSYSVPEEATWEHEQGKRVPKYITATIGFQVIHATVGPPGLGDRFYGIMEEGIEEFVSS